MGTVKKVVTCIRVMVPDDVLILRSLMKLSSTDVLADDLIRLQGRLTISETFPLSLKKLKLD